MVKINFICSDNDLIYPSEIRFFPETATLILYVDRNSINQEKTRSNAQRFGLLEKDEFHLTVIGSSNGEKILQKLDEDARFKDEKLKNIERLAEFTRWKIKLKNEFYYIQKAYDPENLQNPDLRRSIIQIAEISGFSYFFKGLSDITGLTFEFPFPHITLFTHSTKEEKIFRGIGIYSQDEFLDLKGERLSIE